MNEDWFPDLEPATPRSRPGSVVQRWHLPPSPAVYVYFISATGDDVPNAAIKIGISRHPVARIAEMQQHCPVRLEILALCDGGAARERAYHLRFADSRLHGEWFSRSEPLMKLIRWHKARGPLRAVLYDAAK